MKGSQKVLALGGVSIAIIILLVFVVFHSPTGAMKTGATAKPTATATPTPFPPMTFAEFAVPTGFSPEVIITGPDGNLWMTDNNQMQIARMTTSGTVTLFQIPSATTEGIGTGGSGIVTGPDGNLWFTEGNARKIGRLTTKGVFTEYPLHLQYPSDAPADIIVGPDGNLWFTDLAGIVRMTLKGDVTEFDVPSPETASNGSPIQALPGAIISGPDGNLWFTEQADHVGRITIHGDVTQYPLPKYTPTHDITNGPDGNLWFSEGFIHTRIGRITPQGTITTFAVLRMLPGQNIIKGADGNLWFGDGAAIDRITPQGVITAFPLPAFSNRNIPQYMTLGPDGNFWIVESNGKIGRFTP